LRAGPQRAASRRFLTQVRGRPAGLAQVARHIHCFAATILDRVFLIVGRRSLLAVRLHGEGLATELVAAGQGFLLLGSHLGSFEVLRALGAEREQLPLKILMQPEHNQIVTAVLAALNPMIARTVIPLGTPSALLAVKEALDAGGVVGLLGDRSAPGETGIPCRFFGRTASFPLGPLALAAVTRVPVLLFFGLYRGGNRYDVYFEHVTDQLNAPRPQRREFLADWVQRYAARLEHHTRMAPYNWFNFYDFWDDDEGL
jgi:predicted LPLAT superfamily acyltransferase